MMGVVPSRASLVSTSLASRRAPRRRVMAGTPTKGLPCRTKHLVAHTLEKDFGPVCSIRLSPAGMGAPNTAQAPAASRVKSPAASSVKSPAATPRKGAATKNDLPATAPPPKASGMAPGGSTGSPAIGSPRRGSNAADSWLKAVHTCVLTRKLPSEAHGYLMRAAKLVKTKEGEALYRQGDTPTDFYIVESGTYQATETTVDGQRQQAFRTYTHSDTFGSHELILGEKRSVTVTVVSAGAVWVLPNKVFDAKLKRAPAPAPNLQKRLAACAMFSALTKDVLVQLCRAVSEATFPKGETFVTQADPARALYMLETGAVKSVTDGRDEDKQIVRAPASFGHAALHNEDTMRVHATDLTAWAGPITVLQFSVADIEALVGYSLHATARLAYTRELLGTVRVHDTPILSGLSVAQVDWVAMAAVHEPPVVIGSDIVREGEPDELLYVVKSGEAMIATAELGEIASLRAGQYFGELALTGRRHKRTASVCANGPGELLLLSLSASLLKTNKELKKWMSQLDAVADLEAQRAQGKLGRPPPSSQTGRRRGSAGSMTQQTQQRKVGGPVMATITCGDNHITSHHITLHRIASHYIIYRR